MRNATTPATLKCLEDHIFTTFGTPKILICDNGAQFTSGNFKKFMKDNGVTVWYTSRYHPQANATEAANKTAEGAIRAYLKDAENHRDWDGHISKIACAMNTAIHSSTQMSPYFILYGRHMRSSINANSDDENLPNDTNTNEDEKRKEILRIVKTNLRKNYDVNKKRYDLRSRPIAYEVGDPVWVKNRILSNSNKGIISKLSPQYRKCTIKKKIGSNSYEVINENGKNMGIFNTDCFKN